MTKHLFLVFGFPKSGTTFLQRMLDMHPEVSCPVEQAFTNLTADLAVLLDRYRQALAVVDRRTGGQGVPAFDLALRNSILAALIRALAASFAGAKPVCGLNENTVIDRFAYYDEILQRPKMIAIFRNPVDTAVSSWRHNRRLAAIEPKRAAAHLKRLRRADGTLENFVQLFAEEYQGKANAYLDYAEGRPNFITTTYEALVTDRKEELRRLFRFLGCDASAAAVAPIVARSSREAMAGESTDPQFFGVGRGRDDEPDVDVVLRRLVHDRLRPQLRRLGYREPA